MQVSQEARQAGGYDHRDRGANGRVGGVRKLSVRKLRLDGGTQARAAMDPVVVGDYKRQWLDGTKFPPVIAFDDGANLWVADGYHRIQAAKDANLDEIDVEVRKGGQSDAVWYSVAANQTHGLRRSHGDLRKAIEMALRHPKSANMSDRAIAEHVGCSDKTVAALRRATPELPQSETRVGRDGRLINVENIGSRNRTEANMTGNAARAQRRGAKHATAPDKFRQLIRQIESVPEEQLETLVKCLGRRLARSGLVLTVTGSQ